MEAVILAAGKGDRFASVGYTTIKPLILAKGRPMISYALDQAAVVNRRPVIVCPESVVTDIWGCVPPDVDASGTVAVRYTQQGAAMSLLLAGAKLPDDEPVMVMDCDSVVSLAAVYEFKEYSLRAFAEGYVSTIMAFRTRDGSNRYSFVRLSLNNRGSEFPSVVEVAEKTRISDVATCGVHAFSSWSVLRSSIFEMAYRKESVNGEFYVAPIHNWMNGATTAYIVQDDDFTAIGTPEQLEAYEASK